MKRKLSIIAFLAHHKTSKSVYAYEPYVREIQLWSEIYDKIIIYGHITSNCSKTNIIELPPNCKVKNLFLTPGPGLFRNILRIFQLPLLFVQISYVYFNSKILHLRTSGYPTIIVNLLNFIFNKPTMEKWATNFPPDNGLGLLWKLNSKLLLKLSRNKTRVFTYNDINHPCFIETFPALFTNQEFNKLSLSNNTIKWKNIPFTYIIVSRLHPDKNIELIFECVIKNKIFFIEKSIKINIVGDGPLINNFKEMILKFSLDKIIVLNGSANFYETMNLIGLSNFLIMPGHNEGWAKVINESLMMNCVPIIIKGGNPERISKKFGYDDFLFENTADDLLRVIKKTLNVELKTVNKLLNNGKKMNKGMTLEMYKKLILKTHNSIIN